jgi:hypothetical protein
MSLPTAQSPTHASARISVDRFTQLLKSKNSPAVPEASEVFNILVGHNIDPSFALAQFRVESQYGTAGYAQITGSWGNMLYDAHLTTHASGKYTSNSGYTYATYANYVNAITDYYAYLDWYRDEYHLSVIYGATARWIGKTAGSPGHISYVNTIISDMVEYEYPEGKFYESGDKMIYTNNALKGDRIVKRYTLTKGTPLYRGTSGDLLKNYSGTTSPALWLGLVNGSKAWGMVMVKTSSADETGTLVYIKNPDITKVKTVS